MNQKLLLLHGALGSKEQFNSLKEALSSDFEVHTLDFEGHGNRASSKDFSMAVFVGNVIDYLRAHTIEKVHIFGYSMGGYVALRLAHKHPGCIGKIITLGTKFAWNKETAAKEMKMLHPEKIEEKVPAFAKKLATVHSHNDWKEVMHKTAQMMHDLGNGKKITSQELTQIDHEVLIGIGSKDHMVSIQESRESAEALPNGKLEILDEVPHMIDAIPTEKLRSICVNFINNTIN
ncbi:alpha/beta hydrolase [Dokdonia sp.]|uniref:alpha/beta fold hydrolase n=1 Tax=Dokdonia sp. TaxID=2024995 RepID=UPI0032656003